MTQTEIPTTIPYHGWQKAGDEPFPRRLLKPAYTLFLKTGNGCNAGCKSCPAGRKEPEEREHSGQMQPEMFTRVLDRIQAQANIVSVVLHYYNEPTLNPHMPALTRIAKARGIPTLMSTNGSYPEALARILDEGLDNLIFSLSGWTQEIHERSHKNVKVAVVKANMAATAQRIREFRLPTFVRVGWHDYLYNRHERGIMEEYARGLGFAFTSYATSLLDVERAHLQVLKLKSDPGAPDDPAEVDLLTKMRDAKDLCLERRHFRCIYQDTMILVDANGYLYNCPAKVKDHNRRGSLFDQPLADFMAYRREHEPDCRACQADGMHVYAMQQWTRGLGLKATAFRKLEDAWRLLGLGGKFPAVTKWWGRADYARPQSNAASRTEPNTK